MINFGNVRLRRLDPRNWGIEDKKIVKKTGEPYWKTRCFFPKLEQAAEYLLQQSIGDADTLKLLIKEVQAARFGVLAVCRSALDESTEQKDTQVPIEPKSGVSTQLELW